MTNPLHPRLAELRGELERTRDGLLATVAQVPADGAAKSPGPGEWSVAEIVEHLQIVHDGVGRLLGKLAKQTDLLEAETETESLLASLDHLGLRDPTRPIDAPGSVSPKGSATLEQSLAALATSRARLLELLGRVSGRALGNLAASHPLMGRLTFYQWLLFLAQHEERHTTQIRQTLDRLSDRTGIAPRQVTL